MLEIDLKEQQLVEGVMDAWRCDICEHVYLGYRKPDICPHCGVEFDVWMRPIDRFEYQSEERDLDEEEVEYAETALEMEVYSEAVYRTFEEDTENVQAESLYRRIARHEDYHKQEFAASLGVDEPDIDDVDIEDDDLPETDEERFQVIVRLEEDAMQHYNEGLEITNDGRVRDLYNALIDVENEHQDLSRLATEIYNI